ncbi:RusA family crossover junction endodeoxyribonuclease [Lysinibacillus irui]|uniref:RusA family crossover junction endodeoxyribonuclease n=1 Tax=Lysinibacillus irui TaxID=2998077 RepID=UPI004043AA0B
MVEEMTAEDKYFFLYLLTNESSGELLPTTKPDLDNLIKGIKDGCNKVIWHDDPQIVEMNVRRFYSEQPRAEVTIEWGA